MKVVHSHTHRPVLMARACPSYGPDLFLWPGTPPCPGHGTLSKSWPSRLFSFVFCLSPPPVCPPRSPLTRPRGPPLGSPLPPLPPCRGDHDTCSPGSARTLCPPPGFASGRRPLGRTSSCRTGPPPSWRIVTPRRGDRGPRVCGRRGGLGSGWPRQGTLWRCLRGGVVIKTML